MCTETLDCCHWWSSTLIMIWISWSMKSRKRQRLREHSFPFILLQNPNWRWMRQNQKQNPIFNQVDVELSSPCKCPEISLNCYQTASYRKKKVINADITDNTNQVIELGWGRLWWIKSPQLSLNCCQAAERGPSHCARRSHPFHPSSRAALKYTLPQIDPF